MEAWPSCAWMYFGWAPCAMSRLAYVWRRSGKRIRRTPERRSTRAKSRLVKFSGSSGCPCGPQNTSSPWNRLGRRASAARTVAGASMARRERRDFGATNLPRQSARRTWILPPSRSTSSHLSPRSSPRLLGDDGETVLGGVLPDGVVGGGLQADLADMRRARVEVCEGGQKTGRKILVEEQPHAGGTDTNLRSRSAAKARQARMSSRVRSGKSRRMSSSLMPDAMYSRTSDTVIRKPRMHGLPPRFPGSIVIRDRQSTRSRYGRPEAYVNDTLYQLGRPFHPNHLSRLARDYVVAAGIAN